MARFPIPSYSHSGEDRLLWKLLGYRSSGVFVDVGCYHPVDFSNTYLLYRAGWRGLVIDADDYFLSLYRELRPGDKVVNVAVAAAAGTSQLSVFADRSLNTVDPVVARERGPARTVAVETRRLEQVLAEHQVGPVDFLNVDVEGSDLDVLASNDWQRWRPSIVAVEDHALDLGQAAESAIYRFLGGHGYFLHSKCNYTSVYCLRQR
jgi:FkbM family methyltransferase